MDTITKNEIKWLLPARPAESHKGSFGKVMIVAGALGMMGASILSAKAAQRSGAGLVRVSVPEEQFHIVQVGAPEAVCVGRSFGNNIEESPRIWLTPEFLNSHDSIAMGPGLGTSEESISIVKFVLDSYSGKLLLDADALNIIAKYNDDFLGMVLSKASIVITPHVGEAARILNSSPDEVNVDRERAVLELAKKYNCVAVLKGNNTLIAEPGGEIAINNTGNPGMATAGSGDVLSGMIAAFMGEGMTALDAAHVAVYVHGLAGDFAAEEYGTYGLTASDIIASIPKAIMDVQEVMPML